MHDMPTMQGSWKELEKERFLNMVRAACSTHAASIRGVSADASPEGLRLGAALPQRAAMQGKSRSPDLTAAALKAASVHWGLAHYSMRMGTAEGVEGGVGKAAADALLLRPVQEREGAPDSPVIMNPMRHNLPAHIRNAEDLAAMSLDG